MASGVPTLPRPTARDVHVWRIELVRDADRYVASLSSAEQRRLERLAGAPRERFAVSHGAMRQILGAYLGCRPIDVPLDAPSGEPPRVTGLELSLTHCDQLALLAVALTRVGVDAEDTGRVADEEIAALAEATLTPAEMERLLEAPSDERARVWLRSWVRKEAVLKASGEGFRDRDPSEVDVSADRVGGLVLVDLDVGRDHVAAAALTPPAGRVRLSDWIDKPR